MGRTTDRGKISRKKDGALFVISAPSGAGKSTLCSRLLSKLPDLRLSVSYTTRPARKGEINDVHYTFISENRFRNMISRGEFAEWAVVHGNHYGTSLKRLTKLNKEGFDILLDIDVQGAKQIRKACKNALYIFILPPSMEILKQRLTNRKTDSDDKIKQRLDRARAEIASYKDYDYVIINDSLEKAYKEFESVITAAKLRTENIDTQLLKNFFT